MIVKNLQLSISRYSLADHEGPQRRGQTNPPESHKNEQDGIEFQLFEKAD